MNQRQVLVPSQQSFGPTDHRFDDTRQGVMDSRRPLRVSAGNPRHPHDNYNSSMCPPDASSIDSPPMPSVMAMSLASSRGHTYPDYGCEQEHKLPDDSPIDLEREYDQDTNPIYDSPQFRQYRLRQGSRPRDGRREDQIWPDVLEDAFLDALLLIPDMGRKKYSMHDTLYGRNMLISDYIWIAYCASLPRGVVPDHERMKRGRKQVSSHIQVLKNFFKYHRFFHFFFPTKENDHRNRVGPQEMDPVETASLKSNPVLAALSESRFPTVRPNYDYFAQLLASDMMVTVRPKSCWVFVSSSDITVDGKFTARDPCGRKMNLQHFSQLAQSLREDQMVPRGADDSLILHEFTRLIGQKESCSIKSTLEEWEANFPDLYASLHLPEPQHEAALTILEVSVVLELHKNHFPSGSKLNGLVEMAIMIPPLQAHRWKCVTRLTRPRELCDSQENDSLTTEYTNEAPLQLIHQADCNESSGCNCTTQPRQDVRVPFPAVEWATMLTNCLEYPEEGRTAKPNRRRRNGPAKNSEKMRPPTTQSELIAQVGMVQELWSYQPHELCTGQQWTRRALIIWKFKGVNQANGKSDKRCSEPGMTWRFLSVNDSSSEYHHANAYVNDSTSVSPFGTTPPPTVMSVSPEVYHAPQPHMPVGMGNRFHETWDITMPTPIRNISALSFPHGLATPPPSVSILSSYPSSYGCSHDAGGVPQDVSYFSARPQPPDPFHHALLRSSSNGDTTLFMASSGAASMNNSLPPAPYALSYGPDLSSWESAAVSGTLGDWTTEESSYDPSLTGGGRGPSGLGFFDRKREAPWTEDNRDTWCLLEQWNTKGDGGASAMPEKSSDHTEEAVNGKKRRKRTRKSKG